MIDYEISTQEFDGRWHWVLRNSDGSPRASSAPLEPGGYSTERKALDAAKGVCLAAAQEVVAIEGGWQLVVRSESGEVVESSEHETHAEAARRVITDG